MGTSIPKTAGYIIDYSENAQNIKTAMKLFGNYDEDDIKGALIDVSEKIRELEQSFGLVQDVFNEVKASNDDEAFLQLLGDDPKRESFYKALNDFIKNLNECYVLQDFVHEFGHLDMYKRELKKLMELRKAASLRYADRVDLAQYKQSLVNILDQYVDAHEVELLTKQVNITDRKQFDEAVEKLGSDESKAEAIAAQTDKTIQENFDADPEFYDRFSKVISDILEKMRAGKLADVEALKQMKLIRDDVINKKDDSLPDVILLHKGSDVFYRNLKEDFEKKSIDESVYVEIVTNLTEIIKKEAIVDWYKNSDVKRRMINIIDDYLYDVVRVQKNIALNSEDITKIISTTMRLAENNSNVLTQ